MKSAKELFPQCQTTWGFEPVINYSSLYDLFGVVIFSEWLGDYQGDVVALLFNQQKKQYGYLCFGYGSCSCCDALQGCESYQDIDNLIENLQNNIRWFDDKQEGLKFFKEHDWKADYMDCEQFVDNCINFFKE